MTFYVAMMGVLSAPLGGCSSTTPFGFGTEAEDPATYDSGSGREASQMQGPAAGSQDQTWFAAPDGTHNQRAPRPGEILKMPATNPQ